MANVVKNNNGKFAKKPNVKRFEKAANGVPVHINEKTPPHVTNLALLIKNNAAIKRYVALGIINMLRQAGKIYPEDKIYVNFFFDKVSIKINGLITEYTYATPIVKDAYDIVRCILAAFKSIAHDAQNTINEFVFQEFNDTAKELPITEEELTEISKESLSHNTNDNPAE